MPTTVIILKSNQDNGKTSTLCLLIEMLYSLPEATILGEETFEDKDKTLVIQVNNNKRIGIVTIGDPKYEDQFKTGYELCKMHNADIIIVATRTQKTLNSNTTPYGLIWEFIDRDKCQAFETAPYVTYSYRAGMDSDLLNKLCAKNLLEVIKSFL